MIECGFDKALTNKRARLLRELKDAGISKRTLDAISRVPREAFVPSPLIAQSYDNRPLSIGEGQTISQPFIVGYMLDLLKVQPHSNVLEIGTGSGYNLAVLSNLTNKMVISVERIASLAEEAHRKLLCIEKIGMSAKEVKIIIGDGSKGYSKYAPYDRIIVTAGAFGRVPQPLIDQLKVGGILIIPVKEEKDESLYKITKTKKGLRRQKLINVRFVPLISGS